MTVEDDGLVIIEDLDPEDADRFDALSEEEQQAEIAAIRNEIDDALEGEDTVPTTTSSKPKLSPRAAKLLKAHPIYTDDAVKNMPPPVWFIDNLVPAGPRTLIHGAGGARKSFVVLDWMMSAAKGVDWLGHKIRPGKVLYIAGEGIAGLGKRIAAWEREHGTVPEGRIYFMADPINLLEASTDDVRAWASIFAYAGYDYVVVDTVHTAMAGGEENSATEIGTLFANATRIAGGNDGAQVFFVHHDPKPAKESTNLKRSARGSSSFRDSVDVCLGIFSKEQQRLQSVLWCDKVRDAEEFPDTTLQFAISGDGDTSSLYVQSKVEHEGMPSDETREQLEVSDDARRLLSWMRRNQRKAKRWTTLKKLRDDAIEPTGLTARAIEKALVELRMNGQVTQQDTVWRECPNPTPAGQ